jgi:hypothetical protein
MRGTYKLWVGWYEGTAYNSSSPLCTQNIEKNRSTTTIWGYWIQAGRKLLSVCSMLAGGLLLIWLINTSSVCKHSMMQPSHRDANWWHCSHKTHRLLVHTGTRYNRAFKVYQVTYLWHNTSLYENTHWTILQTDLYACTVVLNILIFLICITKSITVVNIHSEWSIWTISRQWWTRWIRNFCICMLHS